MSHHVPTGDARWRRHLRLRSLVAATLLAACTSVPDLVPVTCAATTLPADGPPVAPADTLDLVIHLDRSPKGAVLVRVDPLDEDGVVTFQGTPPPTAAAVAMALTLSGTFQGCVAPAAPGFVLRAPEAPREKAWVRVSSDRPVRVEVRTGEGREVTRVVTGLSVDPGASARADWPREDGA